MKRVVIIGGGAAGMMAAIIAARNGHKVTLLEQNERLGKKLFITGKGRCNITNAGNMDNLFANVVSNPKFLYSAFYGFNNYQVIDFFEEIGVKTKIERGDRVFPQSDKSSDVIIGLQNEMKRLGVKIYLFTKVTQIITKEGIISAVSIQKDKKEELIETDSVIVATGGISYPSTGSTGDGYNFAKKSGHTVTKLYPALVPFQIKESYVKELQGLSLKNVELTVFVNNKKIYSELGEMLFTHFGISGPLVLSASSYLKGDIRESQVIAEIDLKPALTEEQLDARILRDFIEIQNKQFKNALDKLLPKKMIPIIIALAGIDPNKVIHSITKEERRRIVHTLKHMQLTVQGLRGYNEAIITKGGVSVKEINPATMESKLIKGLYFAGEVLDLDALTGGYNLQIAWSTAYLAGSSIEE
ncbi:MAG: NAD(P)/FAD-dependent oxidoreductase [Lachnospiraceae bacterium]|nr:NAD(P)/FAD-dependent oxidoreductase [Lachnospiraceae bacterium]